MYLNKAILIGNLTRDPEMRSLPSGVPVTSFPLATNRVWKDKEGTKQESSDYHNVVLFGKQATSVHQYLRKGSSVLVEGRMQTRSWNDPSGGKQYRTEVVAERVQFGPRPVPKEDPAQKKFDGIDPPVKDDLPTIQAIEYPEETINLEDIPF